MKWFLDTEFNDNGKNIDLISIALVNERGSFFYAVSNEFDPDSCQQWVKDNVLTLLPAHTSGFWMSRREIAKSIEGLIACDIGPVEFWAYYADYDWVVFCQLFGRMLDLPERFPRHCCDLKQEMDRQGVRKKDAPVQVGTQHDALNDARWVRSTYLWLASRGV